MTVINLSAITAGIGGFVINGESFISDNALNDIYFTMGALKIAGDINNDGLDDLIVSSSYANYTDPITGINISRGYVVFGKTTNAAIDLSAVAAGVGGFVITDKADDFQNGWSMASAGDINGDGLADLIVGVPQWDYYGSVVAGHSYVVFGKSTGTAIDLSAVAAGVGGFVINGELAADSSGNSVCAAGDINGDGLDDLVVSAPWSDIDNALWAGRSYVVFGKTNTTSVDLSAVTAGEGGFVINGQDSDFSGHSLSGAGDINGDGLADLIVGGGGRVYVVFGNAKNTAIELSAVAAGVGGFAINAQWDSDLRGLIDSSVGDINDQLDYILLSLNASSVGDLNGDGLADLAIGSVVYDFSTDVRFGRSYVVFGKADTTAIGFSAVAAGIGGFVIRGESANDFSGYSISAAGDINGDGLADIIIGALRSDANQGRSYLVFGKTDTAAIDLSAVAAGVGGFVIKGEYADDFSGTSVSAAGDVNGDGLADLIVAAPYSDPAAGIYVGRSYVIFGSTTGAFSNTAVDQLGGSGNDTLTGSAISETLVGGAGNDSLIGNGGADVLYGGAGNDVFVLNASNFAKLTAGITDGQLARVDGGTGIDSISVSGSAINVDLTAIANQGSATPGSSSRIESIERIDLTGSGNNTLTLSAKDVIDMAGFNTFNNANGWADGSYNLAAGGANGINPEQRHQLVIDGNAGDILKLAGSVNWQFVGQVTNAGIAYKVFNDVTSAAQLLVNSDISFAPALLAPTTIQYTDTAFDDRFVKAAGTLSASDLDGGKLTYSIVGGIAIAGSVVFVSTYGTLTVNKTTGAYNFKANGEAIEPLTTATIENFTITVTDGTFSDSKTLSVNIAQNGVTESIGNDTLTGTAGNDKFNALAGADTMIGGLGKDSYVVDNIGDVIIETSTLSTEIDSVSSSISYTLGANVEKLTLTGSASINGTGNDLKNSLLGNSGNNVLIGGGNYDILNGGEGNDILKGGLGNDILTGGAGQDLFVFDTAITFNIDKINDFLVADDTIQLENAIFTKIITTGTLSADNFIIGSRALDSNDYLFYNSSTGRLYYDVDGSSAGAAVKIAILGTGLALTHDDFVVF